MAESLGLDELLATVKTLPPLPTGIVKLLGVSQSDPAYFERASAILRADPALAGQVIRIANSARYASQSTVDTLEEGIMRVGIRMAVATVTSVHLAKTFSPHEEGMTEIWLQNLLSAVFCRTLSERHPSIGVIAETAYTYGLLHDVGRLVLVSLFRNAMSEFIADHPYALDDLLELEQEHFGLTHETAGRLIAKRWRFPAEMTLVIGAHHLPPEARERYPREVDRLIDLVAFSDHLAAAVREAARTSQLVDELIEQRLERPSVRVLAQRLRIDAPAAVASIEPALRQMERQTRVLGIPYAGFLPAMRT